MLLANKTITAIAGVLGFGVLVLLFSLHSVPTGHRGVMTLFGKVQNMSLGEGLHLINPLLNVINIDIRAQKEEEEVWTYTKDIQRADLRIVFTYSIKGELVGELFQTIGLAYKDKIVLPVLRTAVKDVVGKWEADTLIENRSKAINEIKDLISVSIDERYIQFLNFALVNITYSNEFERAIEEKQIATQNAIKAQNETVRIAEEARQKVITANAEAEAIRIKAAALMNNPGLVDYEAVQRWDGKLPEFVGGGAVPFIDLNKK